LGNLLSCQHNHRKTTTSYIARLHGLDSKSIDFVLALPQAEIDVDIWMELPSGFSPEESTGSSRRHTIG